MTSTWTLLAFLFAIVVVGALVFAVILITKKGERHLDVNRFRSQWLKIEQVLQKEQPASYQLSVLEADKLLDAALRQRGINGQTMGERMKSYQSRWSDANAVWQAHKLRNRVAHETDVQVSYNDARQALEGFKRGLKDVGAI